MLGLMQDQPLLISSLIVHADRHHGDNRDRLAHHRGADPPHHLPRRACARAPARQRARAGSGVGAGDRVATLAWNGYRHLEIYFAVSGMGAVCHTINPRLFRDQIVYIINHAEDSYVFFDLTFAPLVEALRPQCPGVKGWVAMTDAAHMAAAPAGSLCYESCSPPRATHFAWPDLDEHTASSPLLHLGHHRQSQGRALFAPLDRAAHLMPSRCPTR